MHDLDYSKEANKLSEFAERCIEEYPKNNECFKRMQLELQSRRQFRKHLETSKLLQNNRYDLIDDHVIDAYLTDYSKLGGIFEKVDPDHFKIEYNPSNTVQRGKKIVRNQKNTSSKRSNLEDRKELLRGAKQNTSLVTTLLGGIEYIDLTKPPSTVLPPPPSPVLPPPPPPLVPSLQPLSTTVPYASIYDSQSRVNLNTGLSLTHPSQPVVNSPAYSFPEYQQQTLITQKSWIPPAPHMTATLPPPQETRRERTISRVSRSGRLSRKVTKKKTPKSLRKMGDIVEKYDLNM